MKSGFKRTITDRSKLIKIQNPPYIPKSKNSKAPITNTSPIAKNQNPYFSTNKLLSPNKLYQNSHSRGNSQAFGASSSSNYKSANSYSRKPSALQIQSPIAAAGLYMSRPVTSSYNGGGGGSGDVGSPKSPTVGTFAMTPISATNERAWLKKHGKQKYIDFDAKEIKELREYFDSLDEDGSGSIGVDELEDPLIALGLAQSKQKVAEIIKSVDEDGSGQIQFPEFLSIIKKGAGSSDQKNDQQAAIYKFFKDMTEGNLKTRELKPMPFRLYISHFRRQMLMASIKSKDPDMREKGQKIMKAYTKQLASNQLKQKIMEGGMLEQLNKEEEEFFTQDPPKQNKRDGISDMPFLQNQFKRIMLTKIS